MSFECTITPVIVTIDFIEKIDNLYFRLELIAFRVPEPQSIADHVIILLIFLCSLCKGPIIDCESVIHALPYVSSVFSRVKIK